MHKKDLAQQRVRQEAGFRCENCKKSTIGQYAHIIPDAWGGSYDFQNLLFLCYDCHHKFDVSVFRNGSLEANSAIQAMNAIRNSGPKQRGSVEESFMFFSSYSQTIVKIGEGMTFRSCISIFSTDDGVNLLSVDFEDGRLMLDGVFYDENDKVLLEIKRNKFRAHGEILWDLKISNSGDLIIESSNRNIFLNIIHKDPYLNLTGKFYVGGFYIEANDDGVKINGGTFRNNNFSGGNGLVFNRGGGFSLG